MAKDKYIKFFMVDFIEYNMRKVAGNNTIYCADRCKVFDDIMTKDLTLKEEREQMSCFEKCLGKHSDSFEVALDIFGTHLGKLKQNNIITHTHEKGVFDEVVNKAYLLGEGTQEPVYDKPVQKRQRAAAS